MTLKDKAISIKGKAYVLVSDRILFFNENYPNGSIITELISDIKDERVIIRATVTPDVANPERKFVDYSQATWGDGYINKSSALENASTSAVGRCLAYMGIGVIDSIASVDEINKAGHTTPSYNKAPNYTPPSPPQASSSLITGMAMAKEVFEVKETIYSTDEAKKAWAKFWADYLVKFPETNKIQMLRKQTETLQKICGKNEITNIDSEAAQKIMANLQNMQNKLNQKTI